MVKIDGYYWLVADNDVTPGLVSDDGTIKFWDSNTTNLPVKVKDIILGFPDGHIDVVVIYDHDPDVEVLVSMQNLQEISQQRSKKCCCDITIILRQGCQCGGD